MVDPMVDPAESQKVIRAPEPFKQLLEEEFQSLSQFLASLDPKISRKEVHDLRVLSRRLRAALGLVIDLEKNKTNLFFLKCLKKMTQILGPVRSCDVSEKMLTLEGAGDLKSKIEPFKFAQEILKEKRKKLRKKMIKNFKRGEIFKLAQAGKQRKILGKLEMSQFEKALERKVYKAAVRLLKGWHRFKRNLSLSQLHQLRVDLKKWRYLIEIKEKCVGSDLQNLLQEVKTLQEHVGNIHDLEVLQEHLSTPAVLKKASQKKLKSELKDFLISLESEMQKQISQFYNEGEKVLVNLLPLRSL